MLSLKKILGFSLGPIGAAAFGMVSMPIIAWLFSADDIGRLSMLQVACSFSVVLFSLGLDQAYVREFHESKNKQSLLATTFFPGASVLASISLLAVIFYPNSISNLLFSIPSAKISIAAALCLMGTYCTRFLALILRMQERGWAYSFSQVLPKALFLFTILTLFILYPKLSFTELLAAQMVSIFSVTIFFAYNTFNSWRSAIFSSIDFKSLPSLLAFGLPLVAGGVSYWFLSAMGKIFVRKYSSFEELGIYSVAVGISAGAAILTQVFNTIWAPAVYRWVSEGKDDRELDIVSNHLLAAICSIIGLSGLFSWILLYILPGTYTKVQYLIPCCLCGPLFYTLSEATSIGISLSRKTAYSMAASVVAAVSGLICNYLLVPNYGSAGAAIALTIAYSIFLLCRTEFSCYVWRPQKRIKLYLTILCTSICSISFALSGAINSEIWLFIWAGYMIADIIIFKSNLMTALKLLQKINLKFQLSQRK